VELLQHNLHELSRVGARALDLHAEKTTISEVGVDGRGGVDEVVLLHQVSDSTAVHTLAWTTRAESGGATDKSLHKVEGGGVLVLPGDGLEDERNVGLGALSPGSVLATDVDGLLASVLVLRNTMEFSKALSNEVDVLTMALDT